MKLFLSLLASAALVTPALACPNMDHDDNAPRTAEKDKKEAPKKQDAPKQEAPKPADKEKPATDTAKKEQPKQQPAKDQKDTTKKPDKVSSK